MVKNNTVDDTVMKTKENNQKYSVILMISFITIILFSGGFILGMKVSDVSKKESTRNVLSDFKTSDSNTDDFGIYNEVWGKIENEYLDEEISNEDMVYGSIKGMVDSLGDGYTTFLDPEENKDQKDRIASIYQGIGVTLRYDTEKSYTFVETPLSDFPAEKSGVIAGDYIVEVDGDDMQGKRSGEVADSILGEAGTDVSIKFFRPDTEEILEKTLTREIIDLDNIEYKALDNGIYHIEIHKFTESSSTEFNNQWSKIIDEIQEENPRGIVLDLRNNPGGFVSGALFVSEEFLPKGAKIMAERSRDGDEVIRISRRHGDLTEIPLVVLVNGGSASASEIVAGALQDNDRAVLIGEETVGKGVEQKVIELSDGSALHLVFKQWLTPDGRNINLDDPLVPDIESKYTKEDYENEIDPQLEAGLNKLSEIIK